MKPSSDIHRFTTTLLFPVLVSFIAFLRKALAWSRDPYRFSSRALPQQACGFESLFAGREEAEAHHLRALQFPDAEEVAFGPDPAGLTCSRLSEDEQDRTARVDAVAGLDRVVGPGREPVTKEPPHSLTAVMDARRWQPACRCVPDDFRIEVIVRHVATRREAPGELLDDLHVVLRHSRAQYLRFSAVQSAPETSASHAKRTFFAIGSQPRTARACDLGTTAVPRHANPGPPRTTEAPLAQGLRGLSRP